MSEYCEGVCCLCHDVVLFSLQQCHGKGEKWPLKNRKGQMVD